MLLSAKWKSIDGGRHEYRKKRTEKRIEWQCPKCRHITGSLPIEEKTLTESEYCQQKTCEGKFVEVRRHYVD